MIAAADSDTMSWRMGLSEDVRGVTTTIGSVRTDDYNACAHLDFLSVVVVGLTWLCNRVARADHAVDFLFHRAWRPA